MRSGSLLCCEDEDDIVSIWTSISGAVGMVGNKPIECSVRTGLLIVPAVICEAAGTSGALLWRINIINDSYSICLINCSFYVSFILFEH